MGAPDLEAPRAAGVWTLAGDRLIIVDASGPATILVPTEQVRLFEVDLPLPSRAKRMAALPFAIEDRIAEPVESVHIALGAEVGPKRYMVGVAGHDAMARWVAIADSAGLGHAAIVPDALTLPAVVEEWWVDIRGDRALVRGDDGAFACPVAMLPAAWQAAGKPDFVHSGDTPPVGMASAAKGDLAPEGVAERLARPVLDLRQGLYARRYAAYSSIWRRLGWIVALGAAAHIVIATADTLMLRSIANRRAADTRALVATAAPGITIGEDLVGDVTNLLPTATSGRPDSFIPLVTRVSGALAPLAGSLTMRAMTFQANTLTMDVESGDPGLAARIDAALKAARVTATVTAASDGSVRVTASGA
ncbi:MAG: general secretion pathway protein GspL [Sphingomonas sp.]|nr:general secretion pathway protein GspL [Sphingomonas sp.]